MQRRDEVAPLQPGTTRGVAGASGHAHGADGAGRGGGMAVAVAPDAGDCDGAACRAALQTALHYDMYATEYGSGTPVYTSGLPGDEAVAGGDGGDGASELTVTRARGGDATSNDAKSGSGVGGGGYRSVTGAAATNELWRFRRRGCQDAWAAVLFVLTVSLVLVWGAAQWWELHASREQQQRLMRVVYGVEGSGGGGHAATSSHTPGGGGGGAATTSTTGVSLDVLPWWLRALAVLALCLVGVWCALQALQRWPRHLIVAQCWVQAGMLAVAALSFGLSGATLPSLLSALLAAFSLLWLYLIRDRIPFSSALLEAAAQLIRHHVGLVVLALTAALLLVLYALLTVALLTPALLRMADDTEQQQQQQRRRGVAVAAAAAAPRRADVIYVALATCTLFWVAQVLVNGVHVVTAAVTATWYFAGRARRCDGGGATKAGAQVQRRTCIPRGAVRAALTRALTTSFGSICLGSLLVAVIRFVRFLANATVRSSSAVGDGGGGGGVGFLACVALCVLACLEAVVQYFNEYAFVHCAIYGCAYVEAAQRTWRLTQQCFFAAVFNDALVSQATSLLTLAVALLLAGGVALVTWSAAAAMATAVLSFVLTQTVLQLAESAVTTLFVCFAEVPEGLRLSFPELYTQLLRTDAGMTHNRPDARRIVDGDGDDDDDVSDARTRRPRRVEAVTYGGV